MEDFLFLEAVIHAARCRLPPTFPEPCAVPSFISGGSIPSRESVSVSFSLCDCGVTEHAFSLSVWTSFVLAFESDYDHI